MEAGSRESLLARVQQLERELRLADFRNARTMGAAVKADHARSTNGGVDEMVNMISGVVGWDALYLPVTYKRRQGSHILGQRRPTSCERSVLIALLSSDITLFHGSFMVKNRAPVRFVPIPGISAGMEESSIE